ncbi:MAG: peptidylprolyl isomerase [Flavisolibacter sp.]
MHNKIKGALLLGFTCMFLFCLGQHAVKVKKRDRKKDVELVTSMGNIILRLYNATPLHRDNFLRLVKMGYYDSVLFHRVIKNFMIQAGDPNSRHAPSGQLLGDGGPDYTIPSEFQTALIHKKGALAAARFGDDVNPQKASSASEFYIVQGKTFTAEGLDSLEQKKLKGRKISSADRQIYTTIGGTPHLDQNYTVFGEVVEGFEVVEKIANVATSTGEDLDRPLQDVRILKARLIKRKHY